MSFNKNISWFRSWNEKKKKIHFCDFHFNFSTLLEKCQKVQFLKTLQFEFLHKNLDFD